MRLNQLCNDNACTLKLTYLPVSLWHISIGHFVFKIYFYENHNGREDHRAELDCHRSKGLVISVSKENMRVDEE